MNLIVVRAAYDPDAKVWWVEDSAPLNGLNIEAATIDELRDKLPAAVIDLLETKTPGADIAIEVIGHMHTRVKIPAEPALAGLKYACSVAMAVVTMTFGIARSVIRTSLCQSGSCPGTRLSRFCATRDFPSHLETF